MPDDEVPLDLRTRRHLATRAEIHKAALDLFESNGLRATTVHQIATRAGVSTRTFFRHFSSKEQAALPGQQRLLQMIETLEFPDPTPSAIIVTISERTQEVVAHDADPDMLEQRRIARLLAAEPELRVVALTQEAILTDRLYERLRSRVPDGDPVGLRVTAEVAVALWRTTWEHWGELAAAGRNVSPAEVYRQVREQARLILR